MRDFRRVLLALGPLATFALVACAGNAAPPLSGASASGWDWTYAGGVLYEQPHYAASRNAARGVGPLFFTVPYRGGPVIITPKFYFTFWGFKKYGDPDKVQPLLVAYAQHMGGSSHNNIETQYYEDSGEGKTYITNPAQQFGGSWDDTAAIPKKPSDLQVAAEALRAVSHFGYNSNGVYVVATAHEHSEAGFGPHWCSYHSLTYYNKQPVVYSNLPYMPDVGKECGANIITPPSGESAKDEGVTILGGHEFGESITDPQPDVKPGWIGPAGEIGDECVWHGIANDTFRGKSYTMQPMASNANQACVQSYP